jgi:hypothetical protein
VFHAFKTEVEGEVFLAVSAVEFLDVADFVFAYAFFYEVA